MTLVLKRLKAFFRLNRVGLPNKPLDAAIHQAACALGEHQFDRWSRGLIYQVRSCIHCGLAESRKIRDLE
jgi:hypothetical protein